jgi:mutator protein MutT
MDTEGKVAIGLVRKDEKYLIMRRPESNSSSGKWMFPGGRIEDGEAAGEAVKREMDEETGLNVNILRSGDSYIDEGELGYWRIYPFLLESGSRAVQMNDEHDKYEWIESSQFEEKLDTSGGTKAPRKLGVE